MSNQRLFLSDPHSVAQPNAPRMLGRLLVDDGHISQHDLVLALDIQKNTQARLGEILISEGLIKTDTLLDVLSLQSNAQRVDLLKDPPRLGLAKALRAKLCLQYQVVPWLWIGNTLLVATSTPDQFDELRNEISDTDLTLLPVIAEPDHIQTQITRLYGYQLAQQAITRVPNKLSCRGWGAPSKSRSTLIFLVLSAVVAGLLFAPILLIKIGFFWATITLILSALMKGSAFLAQILAKTPDISDAAPPNPKPFKQPRVSIMVPLLREHEIAQLLLKRLGKLTYPKSLLDIVLVLEEDDAITRNTIAGAKLPSWIRVVEVPRCEGPATKPRALNYALDFCRGSIVGVWDAEDAPEPDQIETVVNRFETAPDNVACLQGILDYYNPRSNWISRCFTIEYATWWRLILPGISKLGFIIPLGGTTLFFKRDTLEKLGRWDAHNVTEDADLGVRLARHGYVTELIPTVTYEEANCRPWRWVRQRSRWLKGFMITYVVHMKDPVQLVHDVGLWRFFGLQLVFLTAISQFILAPVLWSFWIVIFGFHHPVQDMLGDVMFTSVGLLFFMTELLALAMGVVAVSGKQHRHLLKWVVTMPIYFMLGTLAAYKAIYEMIATPFYWDKTDHGVARHQMQTTPDHQPVVKFGTIRKPST